MNSDFMKKKGMFKLISVILVGLLTYGVNKNEEAERAKQEEINRSFQDTMEVRQEQQEKITADIMVNDVIDKTVGDSTYHLPTLLSKSSDAMAMNLEILETYKKKIEAEEFRLNGGEELTIKDVFYESYYGTKVYSILIIEEHYDGSIIYKAYNIASVSGKKLSNGELITTAGLTNQEAAEQLLILCGEEFVDKYGEKEVYEANLRDQEESLSESEIQARLELYDEQYSKTIAYENYDIGAEMCLNQEGNLCIAGKIYSMEDNEYYMKILEIKK